jgi:deazaflavin-dependent oxidoreductase (nitroreductase family)
MSPKDWNEQVIEEFRANHGRVGGMFEGAPLLLLTHRGAKTGKERTAPLMYLRDGDRYAVFASKGGAPSHPDWYRNVLAHPSVTVEVGDERFGAVAHDVTGAERDELYGRQSSRYPQFAEYQAKTDRLIPVVALEPTTASP